MLLISRIRLFFSIFILILVSCSGSVPQIGQSVWQVNFTKTPEEIKFSQELSLFVLVEDEDGISDIASIYIIHDESELFWELVPDNWSIKIISGKNWLGSNSISMNDNSQMPSGLYRIVVIDKAGERDSSKINIPSNMLQLDNNIRFAGLIIDSDLIIESVFTDNTLRIYDESMILLKNLKIVNGKINKSIVDNDTNGKAHWISIYSFNEETGTGFIRGPYLFNSVR